MLSTLFPHSVDRIQCCVNFGRFIFVVFGLYKSGYSGVSIVWSDLFTLVSMS